MSDAPLVLNRLTKYYGDSRGIEDVSLELKPNEVFGFLGPNGAGKSTTIRTVMDFIKPSGGSAKIFGLDSQLDSVKAKRYIGYLSGDIALYPKMTGNQIMEFFSALNGDGQKSYKKSLIELFDFKAEVNKKVSELSKGNKQKLGLILSMMHKPRLLILDEPTSGLDPLMQQVFYDLIKSLKQNGTTIFMSSHNLGEVQKVCDRVGFIKDGSLVNVEQVAKIADISVHRYEIHSKKTIPADDINIISQVTDFNQDGHKINLTITGEIDPLIKVLAKHHVLRIEEHETTLEDLFLNYYKAKK